MQKRKYTSVSIPIELAKNVKKEIENTGFQSISDYVIYLLREVLSMKKKKKILSKEDRKKLKEKLIALGYWE